MARLNVAEPAKVASVVLSGSPGNAMRTLVALMVLNGQCGTVRQFERYEDPFQTRYVVFGNVGFILACCLGLLLVGYAVEFLKCKHHLDDFTTIVLRYRIIDVALFLWFLFMSAIITSFFKYDEPFSVIFGVIYIIGSTCGIAKCVLHTCPTDGRNQQSGSYIKEQLSYPYVWEGHPLIMPLVEGYSETIYVFVDIVFLYATVGSTVINDCIYVGALAMSLNCLYVAFLYRFNPYQPRITVHGNAVFAVSQTVVIFMSMVGASETSIYVLLFTGNILGAFLISLPIAHGCYLWWNPEMPEPHDDTLLGDLIMKDLLIALTDLDSKQSSAESSLVHQKWESKMSSDKELI